MDNSGQEGLAEEMPPATSKSPVSDDPLEFDDWAIPEEDRHEEYEYTRRMLEERGHVWTKEDEAGYWNT